MNIPVITPLISQTFQYFYTIFQGNLGWTIIAITLISKFILIPLVLPSMKSAKKMQELKPALDRLKEKHKDKKDFQAAQMALYKEQGINPAAGCLPQIVQIIILISLYSVFISFIKQPSIGGILVNPHFLYLDLTKKASEMHNWIYYILPVLSGVSQLVFSLMMQAGAESHVVSPKNKDEKKKEEDNLEMAQSMTQQMVYMMPLMTLLISFNFESGLILYWVVSTLFSIVQQFYFSGLGGLKPILLKLRVIKQ